MSDDYEGMDIRRLFSKNLRRLRSNAKMSQINLAAEAGLTHNFINDIESGKKWISADTLAKLAFALKAEPYQFFIAESLWNNQGAEIFSLYLEDFQDSFAKMVGEYRERFLVEPKIRSGEKKPGSDQKNRNEKEEG